MIDTQIFSSPILIIFVALVSVLHVASAILSVLRPVWSFGTVGFAVTVALNAVAHIAMFVTALLVGASAEELFLAVMISSAVGMLAVFISERVSKKALPTSGEEGTDGI